MKAGHQKKVLCLLFLAVNLLNVEAQNCRETLSDKSGIISSPNYPEEYPPNTDCQWEIVKAPNMECVLFTVEDFNVPSPDEDVCPGDHFSLDSCGSFQDYSPQRYYCGDRRDYIKTKGSFKLIQHYQLNATSLTVSFHSDSLVQGSGFLMQYEQLDADTCSTYGSAGFTEVTTDSGETFNCLTFIDDEAGSINTVNFPYGEYPAEAGCAYVFSRPTPQHCGIFLYTQKFDLEKADGFKCYDYFGMPGCKKTCGNGEHVWFFEYQKGASAMPLQFYSDYDTQGRGFRINYLQLTNCFNPHQPECPNDHLIMPGECTYPDTHDCDSNSECDDGQICCFNGCKRACKSPVKDDLTKRSVQLLEEFYKKK